MAPQITIEQGVAPAEVLGVLATLPDWFGRPQSTAAYADEAARLFCVAVRTAAGLVGIASLKPATRSTCEIAVIGLRPELHGRGLGRLMVDRACCWMAEQRFALALVTTFGPSIPDASYARTRAFYEAVGFLPVMELADYPDKETPTLYLVRPLASAGAHA